MLKIQSSPFRENSMRNIFTRMKIALASTLILLGIQLVYADPFVNPPAGDPGLTLCTASNSNNGGNFALCAASTCTPTGKTMDVRINGYGGGVTKFPSATCTCPVMTSQLIASLNPHNPLQPLAAVYEGNMKGSCNVDDPATQVWSLFQPITHYPQQSASPAYTSGAAVPQICKNVSGKQMGTNCFSFLCTIDPTLTNGVQTATCTCPIGEGPFGGSVPPGSVFPTVAGTASPSADGKLAACYQNPVSIPIDVVRQAITYQ